MPEGDKPSRRMSRRSLLALLAGGAYLLVDGIYGGPLTLLSRSLHENSGTAQSIVAVYSGEGTWDESVQAAKRMFEWIGYSVQLIGAKEINDSRFDSFDILCIPGGDMYQYARDISATGKEKIRDFVRNGGGYIGICGGAYFASERVIWQGSPLPMTPLAIFSGTAAGPLNEIAPYPDSAMCLVDIVDFTHSITESAPSSVSMLYYWGPALKPNPDAKVSVLGEYDKNSAPAMLAFDYGLGRVFLVGTHPEIEEDSNRDTVSLGDELADRGSNWQLMKRASLWCSKKA